tara:strand:+ start:495 stop:836 length:342 start_codon:yes stop_codon:yes gene_type:complete
MTANYDSHANNWESAVKHIIMAHAVMPNEWTHVYKACEWSVRQEKFLVSLDWCRRAYLMADADLKYRVKAVEYNLISIKEANEPRELEMLCYKSQAFGLNSQKISAECDLMKW